MTYEIEVGVSCQEPVLVKVEDSPVMTCDYCEFQWTDWRGERDRDAAVYNYMIDNGILGYSEHHRRKEKFNG